MIGKLVRQQDLTARNRDAMHGLLVQHFDGVFRSQFDQDLAEKNWVVLVERDKTLVGFSTIAAYETAIAGQTLSVICSGDTIVDPSAWGSAGFPRAWILSVYQLRALYRRGPLIWLLLTSGFRTYRLLPVFWREFYPQVGVATPDRWQQWIDHLAAERFGQAFDQKNGIIRFPRPQQLRTHLREVPESRLHDPHIRFFIERNPGHCAGDELVCIADLTTENLTPAGRRVVYGASR